MPYLLQRYLLLCSFCLLAIATYAQSQADRTDRYLYDLSPYRDSTFTYPQLMVGLITSTEMNSNAITNKFFSHLVYTRQYIDSDMKDQVASRLKDKNRLGYDLQTRISGAYQLKKNTWLTLGLSQRLFYGGTFSRDFFNLVFYGNSMYADQWAKLDGTKLYAMDYYSFSAGATKVFNDKVTLGAELAFIRGGQYRQMFIQNAQLYTEPNGAYLTLDGNFELAYTDTVQSAVIPPMGGAGAGLSLHGIYKASSSTTLSFELRDLGFLNWNKINVYEGDSSYTYDGYDVGQIFSPDGGLLDKVTADSIFQQMGISKQRKSITQILPSTFHFNAIHKLNDKWSMAAGIRYMLVNGYLPRLYIKPLYYINPKVLVSGTLAYGGFGQLDCIVSAALKMQNKLLVSADLFILEYLLMPNKSSGNGLQLSLTGLF